MNLAENRPGLDRGYRPEIDGLRAIAVVAVILFHAGISHVRGGFLGVDIFFVISGYLITAIILAELDQQRFSFARFYERRARRILPALTVMMLLCLPVAAWTMIPELFADFGRSVLATTLFANNVLLYLSAGYFDLSSELRPLMHSWSLGVEEQYYLAVPLLMWAAYRIGKRRGVMTAVAVLTIASFVVCLVLASRAPFANFLLIWSRIWELGAGAMVAFAEPWLRRRGAMPPAAASALSLGALAMIAMPMLTVPASTALPGWMTLVPVGGTCLILAFATPDCLGARLLSLRPLVGIGLISYSAYLYHQPLFAFVRLSSIEPPDRWVLAALIPVILLLAWLSWRWVERPFRDPNRVSRRMLIAFVAASSATLLGAGAAIHTARGFPGNWEALREDQGFEPTLAHEYNMTWKQHAMRVLPERATGKRVLVVGDSFARDVINAGVASGNLDPALISYVPRFPCRKPLFAEFAPIAARADHILIAYKLHSPTFGCVHATLREMRNAVKVPITVIGTKAFAANISPLARVPKGELPGIRFALPLQVQLTNSGARTHFARYGYIDMIAAIDDADGRVPVFTPEGKLISQDGEHLTPAGAAWFGKILFAQPELADLRGGR